MLISRTWLQSYFEHELPDAYTIAETLLLHAFEIEEVYEVDNDTVIDIDVLPNRAHDCLSYAGIAREYAMLTGAVLKTTRCEHPFEISSDTPLSVEVNSENCLRYRAQKISNITVGTSPKWMVNYLKVMGQKSINSVVDATNLIMFETGQPLHAFDADKVVGGIILRQARDGESMTVLGGEVLELSPSDLVICDHEGILALAGVKGGIKAEVTKDTTNIILESANFNPLTTRITARRVKILTDSSKRFENGISSELADRAGTEYISLLTSLNPEALVGPVTDYYPLPEDRQTITLSHTKIVNILGLQLSSFEVIDILKRLDLSPLMNDESYTVTIPHYRLDIVIAEDVIEEIGRIYGYHKISTERLDDISFRPRLHGLTWLENRIKNLLIEKGFYELKNYTFTQKGEVELFNPLASDKKALRKSIEPSFIEALNKNATRADYFGVDRTLVFEIGREYHPDGEETVCIIGIQNRDKKARKTYGEEQQQLQSLIKEIENELGSTVNATISGNIAFFSVSALNLSDTQDNYGEVFTPQSYHANARFHGVSPYPYTTRDISFWTEHKNTENLFKEVIGNTETRFLKKVYLFDTFEKEGKYSYAYSLIFQSNDKTLTDAEVEEDMQNIIKILEEKGCELR